MKVCCEVFEEFIITFSWFELKADNKNEIDLMIMPYKEIKGVKYRINHCPSCGGNVRDITISKNDFKKK